METDTNQLLIEGIGLERNMPVIFLSVSVFVSDRKLCVSMFEYLQLLSIIIFFFSSHLQNEEKMLQCFGGAG